MHYYFHDDDVELFWSSAEWETPRAGTVLLNFNFVELTHKVMEKNNTERFFITTYTLL